MRLPLVLSTVWVVLAACADGQTPVPSDGAGAAAETAPVVVADGREASDGMSEDALAAWTASPALQAAVAAARVHWTAREPGYEEEVRVLAVAEGAFTQPDADQHVVLYLMGLWPRCCPKVGLAVVEGGVDGQLVRNTAFEGSTQGLHALPDLDGDGRAEVALLSSFGMGGSEERSVQIASFGQDGTHAWGGTGLYSGACGALRDGEEAVRVVAVPATAPGGTPSFMAERYTRATCEGGAWVPSGGPEPITFAAPEPSPYTDLPAE